jgi:hypothetical protein
MAGNGTPHWDMDGRAVALDRPAAHEEPFFIETRDFPAKRQPQRENKAGAKATGVQGMRCGQSGVRTITSLESTFLLSTVIRFTACPANPFRTCSANCYAVLDARLTMKRIQWRPAASRDALPDAKAYDRGEQALGEYRMSMLHLVESNRDIMCRAVAS